MKQHCLENKKHFEVPAASLSGAGSQCLPAKHVPASEGISMWTAEVHSDMFTEVGITLQSVFQVEQCYHTDLFSRYLFLF